MPYLRVGLLFLAATASCFAVSGDTRAQQLTPQQKEEEHKRKAQEQQHHGQTGPGGQQGGAHGQPGPGGPGGFHAQTAPGGQQGGAHGQPGPGGPGGFHAQTAPGGQQGGAHGQTGPGGPGGSHAQTAPGGQQGGAHGQPGPGGPGGSHVQATPGGPLSNTHGPANPAGQVPHNNFAAPLNNNPAHRQQQLVAQRQLPLQRKLNAEDQRAKAGREAHRVEHERLIARQKQMALNEKHQDQINARLRLENERLRSLRDQRKETVDRSGQRIIQEPGNRTIYKFNNQVFIHHNESETFRFYGGNFQNRRAPNGNVISTVVRPGGARVEIEVDSYGRPLRRVRILPDGRRFVLFQNRTLAIGAGFALGAFLVTLPPSHVVLPPREYIVDADGASEDDIYGALQAPPIEALDRGYSLDEVLASVSLRERMRSVSINSINFEFGSWEVAPDQVAMLESVAAVMRDIANQNPGEVFLIEGHTDAVGSDEDNLSLSDRRAQSIAQVLSEQFQVPAENLVTQGYGKQFLLVPTDGPERANRRVVIRRITPLLSAEPERVSGGYGDGPGGPGGPGAGGPDEGPDGPDGGPDGPDGPPPGENPYRR